MEHQLYNERPEGSLSPIPYTGIHKGFLYGWVITLALGALSFGYSIGSFSQDIMTFKCLYYSEYVEAPEPFPVPVPVPAITQLKGDLELRVGVAGSLVQIGGAVGSLLAGGFTKYGKKRCIHVANIILVIGCILIISSGPYGLDTDYPNDGTDYLYLLLIGRFIYGFGAGCFTVFVNSFISEVSPNELTGPMGIAFQFFVCAGVLISYLIGMPMIREASKVENPLNICLANPLQFISIEEEGAGGINAFMRFDYWRIVFGIPILFSVLQFILMTTLYNYESPKYLKQNGMDAELNEVMGKIYSGDQVKTRIEAINVAETGEKTITLRETLFDPRYRKATFVGVTLSAMQQLSGINLIIFYGGTIFASVLPNGGNLIQVLIGFMNFAPVIPAYFLIKRFGRKSILTVCSFLMTLALVGTGVFIVIQPVEAEDPEGYKTFGTIALVFINLYIVIFELSLGPLTWLYLTEIMTEKGLSIGVAINLILTVAASLLTPILFRELGGWVFIVCAGFCLLCFFFCLFLVKETKGLSGKQIAKLYSSVPIDADLLETDPINE